MTEGAQFFGFSNTMPYRNAPAGPFIVIEMIQRELIVLPPKKIAKYWSYMLLKLLPRSFLSVLGYWNVGIKIHTVPTHLKESTKTHPILKLEDCLINCYM